MNTRVFVSWSGEKSGRIAQTLVSWLPSVLQSVKPYYTPDDIDKGAKWATEISKSLSECNIGIICLTRESLEKPWILFEAGALSKSFSDSNVCTVLFGVEPTDVKPPLSTFQNTQFQKEDFRKLVQTINRAAGDSALTEKIVENVFEKWWPDLQSGISAILTEKKESQRPLRTDRELLEEILENVRRQPRFVSDAREIGSGMSNVPQKLMVKFETASNYLMDTADRHNSIDIAEKVVDLAEIISYLAFHDASSRSFFRDALLKLSKRKDEIIPF